MSTMPKMRAKTPKRASLAPRTRPGGAKRSTGEAPEMPATRSGSSAARVSRTPRAEPLSSGKGEAGGKLKTPKRAAAVPGKAAVPPQELGSAKRLVGGAGMEAAGTKARTPRRTPGRVATGVKRKVEHTSGAEGDAKTERAETALKDRTPRRVTPAKGVKHSEDDAGKDDEGEKGIAPQKGLPTPASSEVLEHAMLVKNQGAGKGKKRPKGKTPRRTLDTPSKGVAAQRASTRVEKRGEGVTEKISRKGLSTPAKAPIGRVGTAAKSRVNSAQEKDGKGVAAATDKAKTARKGKSPGKKISLPNKFSLEPDEHPASVTRKTRAGKKKATGTEAADGEDKQVDEKDSDDDVENDTTPDITFNKRMTKAKLALLNSSLLADLISQDDKDAAAEEVYGKGAKFQPEKVKRKLDVTDEDEVIPLDGGAEPFSKKVRVEEPPVDLAELKARRKEARKLKRKVRQMRARGELPDDEKATPEVCVMYVGHIPHGFYEKEMRGYFSQFGEVTRLRLSRSKKTARSRGFAFIEFADKEVAAAAAESMDGYLMHGQALVAKVVPPEKVHPETFKGADRTFRKIPFSSVHRRAMIQRSRDPTKLAERSRGVRKKTRGKQNKLAQLGIEYDFPSMTT